MEVNIMTSPQHKALHQQQGRPHMARYIYATLAQVSPTTVKAVRLHAGQPTRFQGLVTKTAPYTFVAVRGYCQEKNATRTFVGKGLVINEAEVFGNAARWACGGFDMASEGTELLQTTLEEN